ncbi:MAG: hypothetical protein ACFE96_18625 [Candidatus Hermodarchaeota archaeon]
MERSTMGVPKKSLEIKITFSQEEIEILEKLLKSRKELRPVRDILKDKLIECQLGLIHSAKIIMNDACPKCKSLNTKEDPTRPPILIKGGNFEIYRQCSKCNTKFSYFSMPVFEVDYEL